MELSPVRGRLRVVWPCCNCDVGESGSRRLVLCVPGALSPSEVETRSSPELEISFGGFRRLIVSVSPNSWADRSGMIRSVLREATL